MKEKLRVGVVGAGFMGELHARAYAESDSANLVAIVDPNAKLGQGVAERYGARHVPDVQELLDEGEIEAFTVALPDRIHVEVTSQILEAGKAVLLEKPMADTLEGARQIAAAAERGGGRLMVGHILRFDPRYAEAAAAVASGQVGDPVHIIGARFSPREIGEKLAGSSSVMFYLGVHDVDAVQWISGKRISSVYSRATSKIMQSIDVDSEDSIFSTCEFEDGSIGALHVGWSLPEYMPSGINARLEVIGTDGVIKLDVHDHGLEIIRSSGVSLPDGLHWPEVNNRIRGDLAAEVRHFTTSVRDGNEFVLSVTEAMRAVAVNDAILRSVETGRPEAVDAV